MENAQQNSGTTWNWNCKYQHSLGFGLEFLRLRIRLKTQGNSMEKFKVGGEITLIFMLFPDRFLHISNPSGLEPIYFRKIPFYREIPHKVQTIVSGPLKAFYLVSFHFLSNFIGITPLKNSPWWIEACCFRNILLEFAFRFRFLFLTSLQPLLIFRQGWSHYRSWPMS